LTIVWRTEVEGVSAQGPARHAIVSRELVDGAVGPATTISFPGPASDATALKLGVGPGGVALVTYSFKNDRIPGGGVLVAAKRPSDDVGWIPQQQLSTVPALPLGVAVTADGTADVLYSQTGATANDTGVFFDRAALHQPFTTAKLVSPTGVTAATGGVAIAGNTGIAV